MAEDENKKPAEQSQEVSQPQTPGEITQENAHLVDFDNLKVRLICLISIPNAFTQISNFLKRRGWEVFVTTEIKDALTQASTFKPDFVLMSVNHPHKKINQFPQIISQTFNIPVVAFGEKTDSKTLGALQTSRANYKVMGHLSGPTAQRKIKQILQEKHQGEAESKEGNRAFENMGADSGIKISSEPRDKNRGAIKFSGHKIKQGAVLFEKNQSEMKSAKNAGYNPFEKGRQQDPGEAQKQGAAYKPSEVTEVSKKELSVAEKIQKDKEDMAAALRELGSEIGSGDLDRNVSSTEPPKSITQEEAKEVPSSGGSKKYSPNNKKDFGSVDVMGLEKAKSGDSSAIQTGDGAGEKHIATQGGMGRGDAMSATPKKKPNIMESEYIGRSRDDRSHLKGVDQRSFIEKATIEIVNIMRAEEHDNNLGLRMVRRVALLSIGHDHHKGYFMIAGHDVGMTLDAFVQEFTDHLKKHCVDNNESMEFGDYINMDCPDYDFFDNGEEGLEFNYVTGFGAGEIGIKFIHDEEAWAHAEAPGNHKKTLIKPEQVVEDKPLAIDLFVHLKRNDKYYKIVSKESELSSERKERLTEKKTEVFINNEDVGTYRSFQTKQKALRAINKTVQRTTKKKAS